MPVRISKFLDDFGLTLLGASHEYIVPGRIVTNVRILDVSYLKYLLDGTTDEWPTALIDAKIPDKIVWDNDLKGESSLKIPGIVDISGGLAKANKGTLIISQVRARVFEKKRPDLLSVSLQARINKWRKSSPEAKEMYKRIKDKLMVQSTWYTTEMTLEFETPSEIDLKAKVTNDMINVDGGGKYKWTSKTSLKITGNEKVPFAIQSWVIK